MAKQFRIADGIGIGALIVALVPLGDLIMRNITVAEIEVLPPAHVDFRTKDVVRKTNEYGHRLSHLDGKPVIDKTTLELSTYAILPVSYVNRGDAGEDFLIPLERLSVKLGDNVFMYHAAYTTEIVPRPLSSWIGETSPRLPAVLEGGRARSDEVVFVLKDAQLTWKDFISDLENSRDDTISIMLEIGTLSGEIFRSPPCHLSINQLIEPLKKTESDRRRYYRAQAECTQ